MSAKSDFLSWDDTDINLDLLLGEYTASDLDSEEDCVATKKSKPESTTSSKPNRQPLYQCPECDNTYNSVSGIRGHLRTKHDLRNIKGKDKDSGHTKFWDVVVITTADEDQKDIFEAELQDKFDRHELPLKLPIHIISDPPGPKIGNGGSTLTALHFLNDKYGDDLFDMKVLLLHAGGQSKRMPSASILGKIFSAIPLGNPLYQMLDFKLAMYWTFIPRMPPGIFVACSDDFLVYNLGDAALPWKFEKDGFTALAHPSSIKIGTAHGVYVLKDPYNIDTTVEMANHTCIEVLQKPTESKMYEKGAVLKDRKMTFPSGISIKGNPVYTDSSFFFGMDVAKKLIDFHRKNFPITCEIDAYGDFLQALGPNSSIDYTSHIPNVSNPTSSLIPSRQKIYNLLKGTNISLLLMNSSRFIHIGTTREFSYHFCFDKQFQEELGLQMDIFNNWIGVTHSPNTKKKAKYSDISQGCVMHSCLTKDSLVDRGAVVEFFHTDLTVNIGQNTIISNCNLLSAELESTFTSFSIPHDMFFHSVPVFHKESTKYVTIFFHITDDLKKQNTPDDLLFLQRSFSKALSYCKMGVNNGRGDSEVRDGKKIGLWTAPIYPLQNTMSESLRLSLKMVEAMRSENSAMVNLNNEHLVSISEILTIKDCRTMLNLRKKLYEIIRDE